jgi:hypothetical protein
MLTRRIAAGACALFLAAPAVAAAQPTQEGPLVHAGSGDSPPPRVAAPSAPTAARSSGSGEGWRIAAIAEASLIAAGALGTGLVVARQRRGSQLRV